MKTKIISSQWHQQQREFYNARDHKRMWYSPRDHFSRNIVEQFLCFAGLPKGCRILELGCGAGRYTIPLLEAGYRVTAVDISEKMTAKLEQELACRAELAARCEIICCDYERLPAAQYDGVVGFNVLHHLSDVRDCFKTLHDYLNPGALVAFLEPNALNPLHTLDTFLDRGWQAEKHKQHSRPENVSSDLERTGYQAVEFKMMAFFPPTLVNLFPKLLAWDKTIQQKPAWQKYLAFFAVRARQHD